MLSRYLLQLLPQRLVEWTQGLSEATVWDTGPNLQALLASLQT
jgi:hypothetical protein